MAKSFTITTTATDTLKADSKGHAEAVFTVSNTTPRPVRGLARVKALGNTKQEWLSIAGESDRDFGGGATEQFAVNLDATGGVPTGKFSFRLDVASAQNPDEDSTAGPTVTVEVAGTAAPPPLPKSGFPKWIIFVIIGVVLVVGIVVVWLLVRTKKVDVPNVVGKPVAEAKRILSDGKLEGNVKETKVTSSVPEGSVAEQSPNAGSATVPEGSTVDLVVEAARPTPTPSSSSSSSTPRPIATQRINVALGKLATQSSDHPTGFGPSLPSKAVDGNTSGNFADRSVTHTESQANAWWQVDLGAVHPIVQIKIWNRTDCCGERLSNFYVFVSSTPFTSTDLNSTLSNPGVSAFPIGNKAGTPTTITVDRPGRFVRVQLVGTDYLSLAEVEVIADVPVDVTWLRDGGEQRIVGGGFGLGDVQYLHRPGAVLSVVQQEDSRLVLSKPRGSRINLVVRPAVPG